MTITKNTTTWLTIILVIASLLRLIGINASPLWLDEGLTIPISEWSLLDMMLLPTDPTPFLYYAIHKLLYSPDNPVYIMRSFSLMTGVISVYLMYILAHQCFNDKRHGLIAAFLLAISTIHIHYSIEARAYSLLFLLTLLMSVCLLSYIRILTNQHAYRQRVWSLLGFGLSCVLAFNTHIVSSFWIIITNIILLIAVIRQADRRIWLEWLTLCVGMAILVIPSLYRLMLQMEQGHTFNWLQQADIERFIMEQAKLYFPFGLWENLTVRAHHWTAKAKILTLLLFGGIVAIIMGLVSKAFLGTIKTLPWYVLLLIAGYLFIPFIVWGVGFVATPIYLVRSILYCLPGFILLLTLFISMHSGIRQIISVTIIALFFITSITVQGFSAIKPDWRSVISFLETNASSKDFVLICPNSTYPAFRHAAMHIATTPMVIVSPNSKKEFSVVENALGTNSNWSLDYYQKILRMDYKNSFKAYQSKDRQHEYLNILQINQKLKPERSIWVVNSKNRCNNNKIKETLLAEPANLSSRKVFEDSSGDVVIERYFYSDAK